MKDFSQHFQYIDGQPNGMVRQLVGGNPDIIVHDTVEGHCHMGIVTNINPVAGMASVKWDFNHLMADWNESGTFSLKSGNQIRPHPDNKGRYHVYPATTINRQNAGYINNEYHLRNATPDNVGDVPADPSTGQGEGQGEGQ